MANISISQMNTRAEANLSDLFEVAYADEQSSTGYASGKMSAEVIANGIVNSFTYTSAMPNMGNRTIAGVMNTMLEGFAPAYDDTQTYAVGDYCTYAGKMYICSTAVSTAGAWDSTKWTETTCAEEFGTDVEVDSALSTTSENPVQNKVITQNINSINANLVSEKTTAKADIVSISDAQDIPAEDVKTDIEPIQDLHGYEYPWVGGAGKNKINESDYSESDYSYSNGTFSNTSVDTKALFDLYIRGYKADSTYDILGNLEISSTGKKSITFTASNDYVEFVIVHSGSQRNLNVHFNNISLSAGQQYTFSFNVLGYNPSTVGGLSFKEVQVETGTSDTSYAPYSNICPITGYDDVSVTRTGVNQWDEEYLSGYYDNTGVYTSASNQLCTKNKISVIPNTAYCFRVPRNVTGNIAVYEYDINETFISSQAIEIDASIDYTTYTVSSNTYFVNVNFSSGYGATYSNDICINVSNTAINGTYYPYKGTNTITATFDNTIYSGHVDFTNGVVTVDKGYIASYNGETLTGAWISDRDVYTSGGTPTTGAEVVYELATPQTIQLTPQQLQMLKGYNTVTTDANGGMVIKYQPANVIGELKKLIYQLTNQ